MINRFLQTHRHQHVKRFLNCLGEPPPTDEPEETEDAPEQRHEHQQTPGLPTIPEDQELNEGESVVVEMEPVANILDRGNQEMQSESSEPEREMITSNLGGSEMDDSTQPEGTSRRRTLFSEEHEDAPVQQRPRTSEDGSGRPTYPY
eukprot:6418904-Amphidinium_carterae.1